jgi:hypothetical protein
MWGKLNGERPAAKSVPAKGRITLKQGLGCIFALVAVPALGLIIVFYVAGRHAKEWEGARPSQMSTAEWADKRSLCEAAELGAVSCAGRPTAEVRRLAASVAEERRQKLCAKDDRGTAIQRARDAVSARLRAPSTAQFVGSSSASKTGCDWVVSGEVDAQNAFGGIVRSAFRVRLRRASDDIWLPLEVRLR